jgi:hypothetical protein
MTAAETERYLLHKLEEEKESPRHALWQLATFYKDAEQYKKALVHLGTLVALAPDVEAKANYVLKMGAFMESAGDYPAGGSLLQTSSGDETHGHCCQLLHQQ